MKKKKDEESQLCEGIPPKYKAEIDQLKKQQPGY